VLTIAFPAVISVFGILQTAEWAGTGRKKIVRIPGRPRISVPAFWIFEKSGLDMNIWTEEPNGTG